MTQNAYNSTFSARYALTQAKAFEYAKEDTTFRKVGKFTAGTALTTTAVAVAIVETALSALASLLLSPAYLITPKRYSRITQHTADSARTVIEAARRTIGRQVKQEEAPPPKIEPTRVERLQQMGANALQFTKKHKVAFIAAAIGASLAAAYFFGPSLVQYAMRNAPKAPRATTAAASKMFGPHATAEQIKNATEEAARTTPKLVEKVVQVTTSKVPEETYIASKKAAKLLTEQHSGLIVSKEYSKLFSSPMPKTQTISIKLPEEAYIASKAAARLLTKKNPQMIVSKEYGKLLTQKNYFPQFPSYTVTLPSSLSSNEIKTLVQSESNGLLVNIAKAIGSTAIVLIKGSGRVAKATGQGIFVLTAGTLVTIFLLGSLND